MINYAEQNPRDTPETMLDRIREYNMRGEKIWGKKLTLEFSGRVAAGTINRWTKILREEERLREKHVTENGVQYKYLYAADFDKKEIERESEEKSGPAEPETLKIGGKLLDGRDMEICLQIKIFGERR